MEKTNNQKNFKLIISSFSSAILYFMIFSVPQMIREGLNFNFNDCFYTPGLFDKTGIEFAKAYIFELPIAFLRWNANTGLLLVVAVTLVLSTIELVKKLKK